MDYVKAMALLSRIRRLKADHQYMLGKKNNRGQIITKIDCYVDGETYYATIEYKHSTFNHADLIMDQFSRPDWFPTFFEHTGEIALVINDYEMLNSYTRLIDK